LHAFNSGKQRNMTAAPPATADLAYKTEISFAVVEETLLW